MIEASVIALLAGYVVYFLHFGGSVIRNKRASDVLVSWPFLLYLPGPLAAFYVLDDFGSLRRYSDERSVMYATVATVLGLVAYKLLLARPMGNRLNGELVSLASRPTVLSMDRIFYILGTICVGFQVALMIATGSWIVGNYAMGTDLYTENAGLWGFTAGLYETFTCLLALRIAAMPAGTKNSRAFNFFNTIVIGSRALSGTRLILIKFVVFVVAIRYIRGELALRRILIYGLPAVAVTAIIGSVRMGDSSTELAFSLLAEPALASLSATVVTDFYLSKEAFINPDMFSTLFQNLYADVIGLVPGFIYRAFEGQTVSGDFGVVRSSLDQLSIFNEVLTGLGLTVISPVGGLSLVAVGAAIFGPLLAFLVFPLYYAIQYAISRMLPLYTPFLLVFAFESASLFRDGTQIFLKQMLTIVIVYMALQAALGQSSRWIALRQRA